jgi:hypothetical protein
MQELLNVKAAGTYSDHSALKGLVIQAWLWFSNVSSKFLCEQRTLAFLWVITQNNKRVAQVSIVSGYGMDDRAVEVRSPVKVKGYFL